MEKVTETLSLESHFRFDIKILRAYERPLYWENVSISNYFLKE